MRQAVTKEILGARLDIIKVTSLISEIVLSEIMTLPMNPYLSNKKVKYIVEGI